MVFWKHCSLVVFIFWHLFMGFFHYTIGAFVSSLISSRIIHSIVCMNWNEMKWSKSHIRSPLDTLLCIGESVLEITSTSRMPLDSNESNWYRNYKRWNFFFLFVCLFCRHSRWHKRVKCICENKFAYTQLTTYTMIHRVYEQGVVSYAKAVCQTKTNGCGALLACT